MNLVSESRLANGRWMFERVNGLLNGLASEFDPISPPVDVVEDQNGYRFSENRGPSITTTVPRSCSGMSSARPCAINAERIEPVWGKDARVHRAERHYGRIHRAFRLPSDVGHEATKAAYKDGA